MGRGAVFKKGDMVELFDSKTRKWTRLTCKIEKFCEKMAALKRPDGKVTRRKHGNFRHVHQEDASD